ncbi:branched-chain amino acid ABC transporter permease [Massilia brevitalea]|uniref:branched-chain amino acid ABC transporter permease n=1 Tax=Massilia brevitalea TaxID=442526 RepID=UPI0027384593|nr:branched-chain amino acid ABC transporter permease [Massilia brevitalea]
MQGVFVGVVYGLVAFPISLLFITTDSVDLAVGGYAVVAGSIAMLMPGVAGIGLGIVAAIVASVLVGLISVKINKPNSTDPLTVVLATFGVATFIESAVLTFLGKDPMIRQPFDVFWNLGSIRISPQAGINVAIGLSLLGMLYCLLYRTSFGRDMRASAVNVIGAALAGIPVRAVWFGTYVVGGLLAGIAGILILYTTGTDYSSGTALTMSGFGAAVLFGLTSPLRGFAGGIIIGIVQAVALGYLPGGWATAAPLLFIFLVLVSGRVNVAKIAGGRA